MAPFSATPEAALREAIIAMSCGRAVEADIVVNQGPIGAQCLINVDLGMHDFHIYQMKSEWECGYDDWSLHQPSNDRYGAMEYG